MELAEVVFLGRGLDRGSTLVTAFGLGAGVEWKLGNSHLETWLR